MFAPYTPKAMFISSTMYPEHIDTFDLVSMETLSYISLHISSQQPKLQASDNEFHHSIFSLFVCFPMLSETANGALKKRMIRGLSNLANFRFRTNFHSPHQAKPQSPGNENLVLR